MPGWTRIDVLGVALAVLAAGFVTMVALATPVPASDVPTYLALAREGVWDVDPWTWAAGKRFVNAGLGYQRLAWAIFWAGGWPLLVAVHGLAVGAALGGAGLLGWHRGRGIGAGLSAVLAAALVFQNHAARPQTLVFPLGVLAVALLVGKGGTRWRLGAWFLLLAIWANLHGSFLVGLGLAASCALQRGRRWEWLAALAGALCTPWGLELFVYAWSNSSRPASRGLNEWARPGLDSVGLRLWPSLLLLAFVGARGARHKPTEWLPVLGLGLLACTGLRHAAWVGVVGGPLLAGWLPTSNSDEAPRSWGLGLGAVGLLVLSGLVRFLPWVAGPPVPERPGDSWLEHNAPVEALDVLAGVVDPTQVCVPFAQGGLVRWRLGRGWTVPVDVRVWLADDASWSAYLETRTTPGECPLLIDRLREPELERATNGWKELWRDSRWTLRVPRGGLNPAQ